MVCSRDVKVVGLLGTAVPLKAKSSAVAKQQVGLGGTTEQRLVSRLQCLSDCLSATAAVMQVVCSRDVKVAGLLGSAASLEAKSSAVAEQQVGLGGTTKWRLASLVYGLLPDCCILLACQHGLLVACNALFWLRTLVELLVRPV